MTYGQDAAAPTPVGRSVREMAGELMGAAENLEERISRLMDRIEGPGPKPVATTVGLKADGPGGPLAPMLNRLSVVLNRCHNEIGRLEDRL